MNLSQARFARRTSGARPGAAVCRPGQPANAVGMLSGTAPLYNNAASVPSRNVSNQRTVNGLAILNNQGDRITRLERKLEQIEQQYAISTSGVELKVDNTAKQIDLMNGEYKKTMKMMRDYIKELEEKIKGMEMRDLEIKPTPVNTQENITLEITDK